MSSTIRMHEFFMTFSEANDQIIDLTISKIVFIYCTVSTNDIAWSERKQFS